MRLPQAVQDKINELYADFDKQSLISTRKNLTSKYKSTLRQGNSFIESKKESEIYAISRMPATYSVVFSLIDTLASQNLISNVTSVIDIGSGTGAGYFALQDVLPGAKIELFERDHNMIEVFNKLTNSEISVTHGDIVSFEFQKTYDMVMSSYVLSELKEDDRYKAVKKMLDMSNNYVLLIDTGTPKVYEDYQKIKEFAVGLGAKVLAPCLQNVCPLAGDYCQFYARVERSAIHKMAKSGEAGYEDEKYFYLLLSKTAHEPLKNNQFRVIRRPIFLDGRVDLTLCGKSGVCTKSFYKKHSVYKRARKIKINEIMEIGENNEI